MDNIDLFQRDIQCSVEDAEKTFRQGAPRVSRAFRAETFQTFHKLSYRVCGKRVGDRAENLATVCPGSSDPFYVVTYYTTILLYYYIFI